MDQRTKKLMTMHKALHPRDDVVKKKRKGHGSIEDSVNAPIQQLEDYIEKCRGRLITATRNYTDNIKFNKTERTRKQKWEEKQLYGRFKRLTNTNTKKSKKTTKTWKWLRKENFKRETESLLIAAQNNAIRINHIKAKIDKVQQNCKCRLCGDRDKMINHISECRKLAQKEYKTRHDWVGKVIHMELCKKRISYTNRSANLSQMTRPFNNQQKKRTCRIADFAISVDHIVKLKESKKKDEYLDLAWELKNCGTW